MAFWKISWDFIEVEIVEFFKESYEHGRLVRTPMQHFWSISLVGGLYKWLAKRNDSKRCCPKLFQRLKMCSFNVDKFWMQCLQPMK